MGRAAPASQRAYSRRIGWRECTERTRREFIRTSAAAGAAAGSSKFAAVPPKGSAAPVESSHLETFSDWIRADREARKQGLEQCLQRIREREPSIHAWVQVQPQRPTGEGPLSEIPFGV